MPDFVFENLHGRTEGKIICGVDEVGRGPLAGPVVAAAVILPDNMPDVVACEINDSKKMLQTSRERLSLWLHAHAQISIAEASVEEIDRINILQASRLAMKLAVEQLRPAPDFLLVDATTVALDCRQKAIIHGDALSVSIAAASILAKVHRDHLLVELDAMYPQYGLAAHKGYPTAEHRRALALHGATPQHRRSYRPVAEVCEQAQAVLVFDEKASAKKESSC